jgi:hypothetical protein
MHVLTWLLGPNLRIDDFLMSDAHVGVWRLWEQLAVQVLGQRQAKHIQEESTTTLGLCVVTKAKLFPES